MIITIKLQNFRKFKNCTFTFDKQLSLISGKSGQGKTTIFMAIIFALTGEGKKVTSFGTSKCSVTLNIKNPDSQITITRTKCPNRLLVTTRSSDDEKSYESEEAQRIIDTSFPQYNIGYMSQRVEDKAFILMSPMDKLRFVQKMAFDNTLYSDMNKKCRDLIKDRREDLQLTSRERETTQNMLRDFDENNVLDQCEGEDDIDETIDFGSLIKIKEKALAQFNAKLSKTQERVKIKTQLQLDINKLEKNLVDETGATMRGTSIYQMKSRIEEIQSQLQQLYSHRQQEERFQKENAKLIQLASPSPPSLVTSDMIHVARRFDELQKSVRDMTGVSSKLDKIKKVIDTSAIPLTCPECDTNLSLWLTPNQKNAKVMLVKGKQENCKTITYEEARSLEEQKCKLLATLTNFESQKKQLEDMQKQHPDSAAELTKAKKRYDEYMKQVAICDSHKKDVAVDLPNHEELEHELRTLKKKWETCIVLEEKRSQEKSIVIKDDSDALIQQIKETQDDLDKIKRDQSRSKVLKYKEKMSQLCDKERDLNVSYPRAVKLQSLIKQAEKQSIEEIISQINAHAHIYMDYFLDDISVTLMFEKGKSLDTTRLNVDVRQYGHVSDLSSLSGGEIARVVLAFTIALAEINNVKLLLLD